MDAYSRRGHQYRSGEENNPFNLGVNQIQWSDQSLQGPASTDDVTHYGGLCTITLTLIYAVVVEI